MTIPDGIFKSYDIRGMYPQEINEENIVFIIRAIHAFFKEALPSQKPLTVVVGRDMRLSSPSLFKVAVDTLIKEGASVLDAGIVSTPTFYFTVFHYGYDCGFQISASHNPKEYNGIKIVIKAPNGLIKVGKNTGMGTIKQYAQSLPQGSQGQKGSLEKKEGILETEVKNALSIVGNPPIKKFKIVADAANAMGGQYIDALFEKVPADLVRMNFKLDGSFPSHQPDPLQHETLKDLQRRVVEEKADLGLAPDGDGDRLFFINEKGEIVPPSLITALLARELLAMHKGATILFDIRYILSPQKIVEENGGKFVDTKVGHSFITEDMSKTGALFGGESSGHYFFRETGNAESQLPVILTVLGVLTREEKPLSWVIHELSRSFESGEINFKVSDAKSILDKLKSKYQDGELSTLDGVAISYPNWRFSVRTSNTEPLLRLNIESYDREVTEFRKKELVSLMSSM